MFIPRLCVDMTLTTEVSGRGRRTGTIVFLIIIVSAVTERSAPDLTFSPKLRYHYPNLNYNPLE